MFKIEYFRYAKVSKWDLKWFFKPNFSIESTCRLLETSPFIAVFFHDDDCAECEAILESLEQVPLTFSTGWGVWSDSWVAIIWVLKLDFRLLPGLVLLGLMGNWQNWLSKLKNHIMVNPTQLSEQNDHPVLISEE